MAIARQHLKSDRILASLIVDGKATGTQLGCGSYGSVEEVDVNGLICAGKKLHGVLLDDGNTGTKNIIDKLEYLQECQLMSSLRHPNITQFLGLCFLPDSRLPVLLMERLNESLDNLLETVPNIALALKQSILEDVAKGLLYLHNYQPPIVHRDLTARNVLLTESFVAKITDFGNSRIINLKPCQLARTLSRFPGTLVYMPPEAIATDAVDSSHYGPSLDIFSFGHLTLYVALQTFPGKLLRHNYPDPEKPGRRLGRSEIERREEYFKMLEDSLPQGNKHLLFILSKECLNDDPSSRPTAENLFIALQEMKATIECPYGIAVARIDAVKEVLMVRALGEGYYAEKNVVSIKKDEEIKQLQQELIETQERQHNSELEKNDLIANLEGQLYKLQINVGQIAPSVSKQQRRNVLLLGKTGTGKSTLGNKLTETSNIPEGNRAILATTETSACTTLLVDKNNHYIVQVVDTVGFFNTQQGISNAIIMKKLSMFIKERIPNGFNIVMFVYKAGGWTSEEQETFDCIISNRHFSGELSSISALIITGCDGFTDMQKTDCIKHFIEKNPMIAQFMQKGIHAVGFPDTTNMAPIFREVYEESIKSDQEYLRQLVYSCNEIVQVTKSSKCRIS